MQNIVVSLDFIIGPFKLYIADDLANKVVRPCTSGVEEGGG